MKYSSIAFLGIFFASAHGYAADIQVPCGSVAGLQSAIDSAPAGSVLKLAACTYSGPTVKLSKPVSLSAGTEGICGTQADSCAVTFEGNGTSTIGLLVTARAANVSVSGIKLQNYTETAMQVSGPSKFVFKGNRVENGGTWGVRYTSAEDAVIDGNHFSGAIKEGARLNQVNASSGNRSIVKNNVFTENCDRSRTDLPFQAALKVHINSNIDVINNTVVDNECIGIWLDNSVRDFRVLGNTSNDTMRIEVSGRGLVQGNKLSFTSPGGALLQIANSNDVTIDANTITNGFIQLVESGRGLGCHYGKEDPFKKSGCGGGVTDYDMPWQTFGTIITNNVLSNGTKRVIDAVATDAIPKDSACQNSCESYPKDLNGSQYFGLVSGNTMSSAIPVIRWSRNGKFETLTQAQLKAALGPTIWK